MKIHTVKHLEDAGFIQPPRFLSTNIHYETIMGSIAYGVSSDTSDIDIYGFVVPPKDVIFPHLRGIIPGFGRQVQKFEQYQKDGIEVDKRSYDITIYSIVKFFHLAMQNNPNIIDSLFTPQNCVTHITKVGNMVREQRRLFLHKGSWHKLRGYSYAQLNKISTHKYDQQIQKVRNFEKEHGLPHSTKFCEIIDELEQRNSI